MCADLDVGVMGTRLDSLGDRGKQEDGTRQRTPEALPKSVDGSAHNPIPISTISTYRRCWGRRPRYLRRVATLSTQPDLSLHGDSLKLEGHWGLVYRERLHRKDLSFEPMDALIFRAATAADLPRLVEMLADDALGAMRERSEDPLPDAYCDAFAAIEADPAN